MRAQESFKINNQAAGTFGPYSLDGGVYQLSAHATWGGGNLILQQILPDGATALTLFGEPQTGATPATWVGSLLADGAVIFKYLPPGSYQLVSTTATAMYAALTRVPLE